MQQGFALVEYKELQTADDSDQHLQVLKTVTVLLSRNTYENSAHACLCSCIACMSQLAATAKLDIRIRAMHTQFCPAGKKALWRRPPAAA